MKIDLTTPPCETESTWAGYLGRRAADGVTLFLMFKWAAWYGIVVVVHLP